MLLILVIIIYILIIITSQTEERILYCGTSDEYCYMIIDKIGTGSEGSTKYKINIRNKCSKNAWWAQKCSHSSSVGLLLTLRTTGLIGLFASNDKKFCCGLHFHFYSIQCVSGFLLSNY